MTLRHSIHGDPAMQRSRSQDSCPQSLSWHGASLLQRNGIWNSLVPTDQPLFLQVYLRGIFFYTEVYKKESRAAPERFDRERHNTHNKRELCQIHFKNSIRWIQGRGGHRRNIVDIGYPILCQVWMHGLPTLYVECRRVHCHRRAVLSMCTLCAECPRVCVCSWVC